MASDGQYRERMHDLDEKPVLNVAAICPSTRALGPGVRSVVWVQGCTIQCPGCIAPDWIPVKPANLVDPEYLAERLLANPDVTGLTISGGEPMLQASSLALLARKARKIRDISIICFTGYRFANLLVNPPTPGIDDFLHEVDVLVDGPYLASKNDNRGMRGSSNQKVHYLSQRLKNHDFDQMNRRAEIYINEGHAFMVGIPTQSLSDAFTVAVTQARQLQLRMA